MDIKQTWARRRVRVNICKVSQGNGDTSTWWTSFDPNDDVIYLDLEWERALNFSRWWKSRSGESTHDIVPGATMTLSWTINFLLSLWRHTQEALLKGLSESTLCLLSIPRMWYDHIEHNTMKVKFKIKSSDEKFFMARRAPFKHETLLISNLKRFEEWVHLAKSLRVAVSRWLSQLLLLYTSLVSFAYTHRD